MFIRKKRGVRNGAEFEYLQIVRSCREGQKVRQKVIATLGRSDKLLASGEIDGLLRSLAKFTDKLRFVEARRSPDLEAHRSLQWGPALVFGRLWDNQGVPGIIEKLSRYRKFEFDVERAAFAMARQRLGEPGSELGGSQWVANVEAPGFQELALQHFYRTTAFLAEFRSDIETELSWRDRDLFSQDSDVMFIDTTSVYVYRDAEDELFKRGHSRDHKPHLPQLVLCVVVNTQGWPVAWEAFPGNTADVCTFEEMVKTLRKRLSIRNVVVVADRGMISNGGIKFLTEDQHAPFEYVFGCRMRRQKEVNEEVLARGGGYQRVKDNLEVKEVRVADRRYIVCRNPIEARNLTRPVGRRPKSGIQLRLVDLRYQAKTWDRERRVVAKIEWHEGELFPRIGFFVTNSRALSVSGVQCRDPIQGQTRQNWQDRRIVPDIL